MPAAERDRLRAVQERLLAAITDPEPDPGAEELVRVGRDPGPGARLAIYRRMYIARLGEALADDYAGVKVLLGDDGFDDAVRGYVRAHPPSSFTLHHLGARFPDYLRARRGLLDPATNLAELEGALARAFVAEDAPCLTAAALAGLDAEAFARARLELSPAVALIAAEYPVCRILDAVRAGEDPPLARSRSYARVWRQDLVVWREPISRTAFELLSALQDGAVVADAFERAASVWDGGDEALEQAVFSWFGDWVSEEMFSAITVT